MKFSFYYIPKIINTFCCQFKFLAFIILLSLFQVTSVNAKKVILGSGSGSVSQTSMAGLIAGDTLAITPGTYSNGGDFSDLHDITIINNGGIVTFSGTVNWGGKTMHNIKWTGVGYSGAFYGFVFSNPSGLSTGIFGAAIHTDSVRFDHFDFENISVSAFDFSNNYYANSYNGITSSFKMHCITFSDIKVFSSSLFIVTGYADPTSINNNLCDSIDMHNIIIENLQGAGQQVVGLMTHFNMYNWTINYTGNNLNIGDQGIFNLSGNGSIHHNYMRGGRGYLARINGFSIKPLQDSVLFYNNILLSTSQYGGLDIRCDSSDIQWTNSTYINPIKNVYVMNNTIGNKWNQGFVVPVVVQYQMNNNNILYCQNNLSFAGDPNISGLPNAAILIDFNVGNGKVDSSNNRYYTAANILSQLQDTLATCRPKAISELNGNGIPHNFIITDFYGKIRPAHPSIGAVEYAGISSTVLANAGTDQIITLPLDSVTLNASASTAINSSVSSYQWVQISGPSIAKLGTPNLVKTLASALQVGKYIFGLKVKNSNNDSSLASIIITVNPAIITNLPPVANAGPDQTINSPVNNVIVDGSLSSDVDGSIATFLWSQISGPSTSTITNSKNAKTTISGLVIGIYIFKLTVTDNLGLTSSAQITINVNVATAIDSTSNVSNETIFVFPNPTINFINLALSNNKVGAFTISIIDVNGNLILSNKINKLAIELVTQINVSQLAKGTYFILTNFNNSNLNTVKFFKL